MENLIQLSKQLGEQLSIRRWILATAESCTGGWLAEVITAVPESSRWFDRGFITYTNLAKQEMLSVSDQTLVTYGAVSEQTVQEMAEGALQHSHADISVAISGIAGPGGGTLAKPVGLVYFAWASEHFATVIKNDTFAGERQAVREQAVAFAIQELLIKLSCIE